MMSRKVKQLEGADYTKHAKRVRDFAEKFFQDSGQTEWPTFRTVAYRLKLSQAQVQEFCNEGIYGLMETQYNVSPADPLSNHFVEVCE
jgi:hypothetical protein